MIIPDLTHDDFVFFIDFVKEDIPFYEAGLTVLDDIIATFESGDKDAIAIKLKSHNLKPDTSVDEVRTKRAQTKRLVDIYNIFISALEE